MERNTIPLQENYSWRKGRKWSIFMENFLKKKDTFDPNFQPTKNMETIPMNVSLTFVPWEKIFSEYRVVVNRGVGPMLMWGEWYVVKWRHCYKKEERSTLNGASRTKTDHVLSKLIVKKMSFLVLLVKEKMNLVREQIISSVLINS